MCFSLRSFMNRCLGLSSPTRSIRIRVPLLGSRSMLCGRASGPAPNIARSLVDDSVMVASGSAGFQVLGRTQIDDGHIVIAVLTAAPAGSLWCGIDVEAGTVLLYGPGAEHTAISPEGLEYLVASIETANHRGDGRNARDDGGTPSAGRGTRPVPAATRCWVAASRSVSAATETSKLAFRLSDAVETTIG